MLYAEPTELKGKRCDIFSASNMSFPYHIHRTYEIMRVVKGTAQSVVAGVKREVPAGESVVVFPLQYHSFSADASSQILAYIFTPEFIPEFDSLMKNKIPQNPVFHIPEEAFALAEQKNVFAVKAFFYTACDLMARKLPVVPRTSTANLSVLDEIFLFVAKNYDTDCSLKTLSETLKYDYSYLSKQFKAKTGLSYKRYVNDYRVSKACYQLINEPEKTVTRIAADTGFETVRTFNREFAGVTGMTPLQYKNVTIAVL